MTDLVRRADRRARILIPGCGSNVHLQRHLLEQFGDDIESMVCTDFSRVVSLAATRLSHPKVRFEACDTRAVDQLGEFDVVIVVNSILSCSDMENRRMIDAISRALAWDGALVGIFPTVMIDIDLISLGHDDQAMVDLKKNLAYDPGQDQWQIGYSPLRLRRIVIEAGLMLEHTRLVFLDSKEFLEYSKQYYKIEDPDMPVYELGIVARKRWAP